MKNVFELFEHIIIISNVCSCYPHTNSCITQIILMQKIIALKHVNIKLFCIILSFICSSLITIPSTIHIQQHIGINERIESDIIADSDMETIKKHITLANNVLGMTYNKRADFIQLDLIYYRRIESVLCRTLI